MKKLKNTVRIGTNQKALYECPECGKHKELYVANAPRTKTCGCVDFHTKHGHNPRKPSWQNRHSPTYCSWAHMKQRCDNPNTKEYPRYGGKGISYDPAWADFEAFLADMGERPSTDHCLSRIDHDGNYEMGNVIWGLKSDNSTEACERRWATSP